MKILFIQTGGTIDKDYPKTKHGFAFEITEPAVSRILSRVSPGFQFEILTLLRKDSMYLTNEDRCEIYKSCNEAETDKIVITHGTDTMIETAEILSDIKGKAIVLTGAFRPERFKNSDADFNIGVAVGALNVLSEGVYIAMNGRVYPHNKVGRDSATGEFIELK
ncbi:MAG: asparaginase [Bacteroidia bacterium]|nr:asparaginase [Bacteroidia bacterium]